MFGLNKKSETFELEVPGSVWLDQHVVDHNTPDIASLERKLYQLIFVYDEMMKPFNYNELLGDEARLLKMGFTHEKFTMWKKHLGGASYPVVLDKRFENQPSRPIMGELWAIRPDIFLDLDNHKDNGTLFTRRRVNVIVPYRHRVYVENEQGEVIEVRRDEYVASRVNAWMYVGNPEVHDIHERNFTDGVNTRILARGVDYSPVTRYEPNNPQLGDKEYYYFAPKELDD
jgi:hypothetical protein